MESYNEKLIKIIDGEKQLSFTFDNLMNFHGGAMPGGVALACRMMQTVFDMFQYERGRLPKRGETSFYSGLGEKGEGILDAMDLVLELRKRQGIKGVNIFPIPETAPRAPGNGRYYFELTIEDTVFCISLKEGLIPKRFFELSEKRHSLLKIGEALSEEEMDRLMVLRQELAKAIMKLDGSDLFSIISRSE